MMLDLEETILNTCCELLRRSATKLPTDVKAAISKAYHDEKTTTGKTQLRAIMDNIDIAEKEGRCICQDTGVPLFFVRWGLRFGQSADLNRVLAMATKRATLEIPLRPNVINPLTKENPGTNVGWMMPYVYYDIDPYNDYLEITAVPKGFGCEAKSILVFVATSESVSKAVLRCTLENTFAALGEPCPPTIVGIGIGGTSDIASYLAKKATLRSPLGSPNSDPLVADLENKILGALNRTGIGPMGLGGDCTSLAVHIELCGTHTAAVPVVINYQCWAARHSTARIYRDGRVSYVTHP